MLTLLLDAGYTPVAKISWERAITLIFLGKAEVVSEYEDKKVRSVTLEFKVPSIIKFVNHFHKRKKAIKFTKENVYLRDRGHCSFCRAALNREEATYDHIVPKSRGGETSWTNIVLCCQDCNMKKSNRTPSEAGMKLLTKPVRPEYLPEHLRITLVWRKGMPVEWRSYLTKGN